MSTHRDCGAQIRWARRTDNPNRWMPPLELAGEFYVFDEDGETAKQKAAYVPHECDPDQMVAWAERQIKIAQAHDMGTLVQKAVHPRKDDMSQDELEMIAVRQEADRQQRNEELWDVALKVECRTCGNGRDVMCRNMSVQAKKHYEETGEVISTRQPHPQRIKDGYAALAEERKDNND